MCFGGGGGGDGGAAAREAERQRKMDEAIAKIDDLFGVRGANAAKNKAAREKIYGGVRDDVIAYQRPELDRQKVDSERGLKFSLAGRGLTGGSVDVDQGRELQDRYLRGILELTNQGDAAANNVRAADSRTRLDMIGRINAGADAATATSSALNELNSNITSARDQAFSQNVGGFFDDLLFVQKSKNDYLNGQQLLQSVPGFYGAKTNTTGSTGTVTGRS